jgi:hypothetical protein
MPLSSSKAAYTSSIAVHCAVLRESVYVQRESGTRCTTDSVNSIMYKYLRCGSCCSLRRRSALLLCLCEGRHVDVRLQLQLNSAVQTDVIFICSNALSSCGHMRVRIHAISTSDGAIVGQCTCCNAHRTLIHCVPKPVRSG